MRLKQLRMCGTFLDFDGVQAFLWDGKSTLTLNKFGTETTCETWSVPINQYVSSIRIGYNANKVTYLKASTNQAISFEKGRIGSLDKTFTM